MRIRLDLILTTFLLLGLARATAGEPVVWDETGEDPPPAPDGRIAAPAVPGSGRALLHKYLQPDLPAQRRDALAAKIVALGDEAVPAILDAWTPANTADKATVLGLTDLLAQINTASATRGLKQIIGYYWITLDELGPPAALATYLVSESKKDPPALGTLIWLRLPHSTRALLTALEKGRTTNDGTPRPVTLGERYRIMSALNEVLSGPPLQGEALQDLRLGEEGTVLYERSRSSSSTLAPLERVRYNRILLETTVGRLLRPGVAALDPHVHRGAGQKEALAALGRMTHEDARTAILSYQPVGMGAKGHIRALAAVPGQDATTIMAEYLLHPDPGLSAFAGTHLHRRLLTNPSMSEYLLLRNLLSRYTAEPVYESSRKEAAKMREAPQGVPSHGAGAILRVGLALKDRDTVSLFERAAESHAPVVSSAATAMVLDHPRLMKNSQRLQRVLGNVLTETEDPAMIIKILTALQKAQVKGFWREAISLLELEDLRVKRSAMDYLAVTTGEAFGRNPEKWLNWAAEQE